MFAQSLSPTFTSLYFNTLFGSLTSYGGSDDGLWATVTINLVTAGPTQLNRQMVLGGFTNADFSGYAPVLPAAATSLVNFANGNGQGALFEALFLADGAVTPPGISVIGYTVVDGNNNLVAAEYFPRPILFVNAGDFLNLQLILGWPNQLPTA